MNTASLVSPETLRATSIFVVGLSVLLIAAHGGMLALVAKDARVGTRARFGIPLLAAALLAIWFGWAESSALARAAVPPGEFGGLRAAIPVVLTMLGLVAAGSLPLVGSKTMRVLNAATPSSWLIGVQVYRMAGAMMVWPFMTAGVLPAGFALPAGIGDFFVGATAPFVAAAVASNRPGARGWAVAWNAFGIIDLIVAPTAAIFTQAPVLSVYPLGIIPLFLGPPLGVLTHIYSLRNLSVTRGNESVGDRVGEMRAATA